MAACAYCGSDTELYNGGVPICLKCADLREANSKNDRAVDVRTVLARALTDATLRAESASVEFKAVTGDIPSFIPQPDGTQRIHNASRALSAARDEMIKAHKRLNDFLNTGIVPEDLDRSG